MVAGIALVMWRFDRPPFDLSKLDQLNPGMSPDAVRQVLGEPSSKHERCWEYSGWLSWPIVYIEFDESGALKSHRYDR
jgi:hypothetical protein